MVLLAEVVQLLPHLSAHTMVELAEDYAVLAPLEATVRYPPIVIRTFDVLPSLASQHVRDDVALPGAPCARLEKWHHLQQVVFQD